ncbi:MAG: ankyrin repeat domain-containing protein [Chlamydiales bacterium]|nr:ankyrin repeat domain-containing protein [Chlamydiales bacterium]
MSNYGDYSKFGGSSAWEGQESSESKNTKRPRKKGDQEYPAEEAKRTKKEAKISRVLQEKLPEKSDSSTGALPKKSKVEIQAEQRSQRLAQRNLLKREPPQPSKGTKRDREEVQIEPKLERSEKKAKEEMPQQVITYTFVSVLESTQDNLLKPMQRLGYEVDQLGVCVGFASMAMQAVLADDVSTFNERVQKLRTFDFSSVDVEVSKKSKAELKERADILAFFDGISLYQNPGTYKEFLERPDWKHNARLTSQEIAPIDLVKKEGPIVQIAASNFLFTPNELHLYFEELGKSYKNASSPIAINLSANQHAICVGYFPEPRDEWCLFDANLPSSSTIKNPEQLAKAVLRSLLSSSDTHIAISMDFFTTKKNQSNAENNFLQVQKDTASMREVTSDKAQVRTKSGKIWLNEASGDGEYLLVESLLKNNANPNSVDGLGLTPLYSAAMQGQTDVVRLLLEHNADPNKALEIQEKTTPLFEAADNGYIEIAKLLIEKNADVNKQSTSGITPLFMATQGGHVEIVKMLLAKGADVNLADIDELTPLLIAAQNGYVEIVTMLLEKNADVNKASTSGITALFLAAQEGHTEIVKLLLEKNADPNKADDDGETALQVAQENGHTEVVKLLKKE